MHYQIMLATLVLEGFGMMVGTSRLVSGLDIFIGLIAGAIAQPAELRALNATVGVQVPVAPLSLSKDFNLFTKREIV